MRIKTSETEIKHLSIAWLAISFAFSVLIVRWTNWGRVYHIDPLEIFILSLVTVGSAFVLHELAHKFVAQRYGCWSEFRMEPMMLFMGVLFPLFVPFIFAAPGAVMIFKPFLSREENGKIAVAGPLMNVALVFFFLPLKLFPGMIGAIGDFGAMINGWIALFNMIPFGVLDGRKVLGWDGKAYGIALMIALFAFFIGGI
ncbi:MAG: zinc metalloprotease [Candidatus Syntropharchaeia archaeon]